MKKAALLFVIVGLVILALVSAQSSAPQQLIIENILKLPTPTPKVVVQTPPTQKVLLNDYHVFQTFNNCGPAALSMALSYYGVQESQSVLGLALRPYQVPGGDNDDKSVTLDELAQKSIEFGFIPYHRPGGTTTLVKQFITYEIPVITRTLLHEYEDIGHYRLIKGYDDITNEFIQDDSLQGKNLRYSYSQFDTLWQQFNYEYLVLVPTDKKDIAEAILGENVNELVSWQKASQRARDQLKNNPNDLYARLNLSVALYHTGDYSGATAEFEKIEHLLPFRTLWYQIEPIRAYSKLGNDERVLSMTQQIFTKYNRAFSELYILRGDIYKTQGNIEKARSEYEKAVLYNSNMKQAQEALATTRL